MTVELNVSGNKRGRSAVHGEARDGACTPEYRAWMGMKARCLTKTNHKYPIYGGRGILVCKRWADSYELFLADVGRRPSSDHSVDRIDVNGNYEPGNVRWATRSEQANNKRTARLVCAYGRTQSIVDWSRETGVPDACIRYRVASGWQPEEAVSRPPADKSKKAPSERPPSEHRRARLAVDDVRQIRTQRGFLSVSALARTFGVSRKAIQLILDRKNWAHV